MSAPSNRICPLVGRVARMTSRPTVVFPQPLSPTRPIVRPRSMSRSTPSTAFTTRGGGRRRRCFTLWGYGTWKCFVSPSSRQRTSAPIAACGDLPAGRPLRRPEGLERGPHLPAPLVLVGPRTARVEAAARHVLLQHRQVARDRLEPAGAPPPPREGGNPPGWGPPPGGDPPR